MLRWTITFIVIALIAGVLGFTGIAGAAAGIAKILFFIFLILFVISLLTGKKRIQFSSNSFQRQLVNEEQCLILFLFFCYKNYKKVNELRFTLNEQNRTV